MPPRQSKDNLLKSALQSFIMQVGQESIAVLEQYSTATDKLRALAQEMARFCRVSEGIFSLFVEFWLSSPQREEAGRLWVDLLEQYNDVVVGLIGEGVTNGEFKPVDAESLVWAMLATYDGLATYVMMMPDLDPDRVSQVFVETLLDGLMLRGKNQGEE